MAHIAVVLYRDRDRDVTARTSIHSGVAALLSGHEPRRSFITAGRRRSSSVAADRELRLRRWTHNARHASRLARYGRQWRTGNIEITLTWRLDEGLRCYCHLIRSSNRRRRWQYRLGPAVRLESLGKWYLVPDPGVRASISKVAGTIQTSWGKRGSVAAAAGYMYRAINTIRPCRAAQEHRELQKAFQLRCARLAVGARAHRGRCRGEQTAVRDCIRGFRVPRGETRAGLVAIAAVTCCTFARHPQDDNTRTPSRGGLRTPGVAGRLVRFI